MSCPCHIASATKELVSTFNANDFLIDLYFHFDWSSKRKNILEEYFISCDKECSMIINFIQFSGLVFESVLRVHFLSSPEIQKSKVIDIH